MSEEKLNTNTEIDNDEVFSDEEYEKALAALNSSKNTRMKNTKKKKEEVKKADDESTDKNPSEAQKKDPVIIGCIVGIALVIIGAVCYFLIPKLFVKNLGVTVNDIRTRYAAGSIYSNSLSEYDLTFPAVEYPQDMEGAENNDTNLKYFRTMINPDFLGSGMAIAVEGNELENNGMVTELHVMITLNTDSSSYNFYLLYFASFLQTFNPSLSDNDAVLLAAEAINNFSNPNYYVMGDIAYRAQVQSLDNSISFIQLELLPAGKVDKGLITQSTVETSSAQ